MVMAEQGMGDTIQFVRYVPMMVERDMRVVVAAQAPLLPLLRTLRGVVEGRVQIINQIGNYPPYDLHCPMLSMPRAFFTNLETVRSRNAYLAVPEASAARWRLEPLFTKDVASRCLRVGLVWGGNARHVNDYRRSVPLAALAPLFQIKKLSWFSLQVGDRAEEQKTLPPELMPPDGMTDLGRRLTDFCSDGRGYLSARSRHLCRYGCRTSGGRPGKADLGHAALCTRLAMADDGEQKPMVSVDASFPTGCTMPMVPCGVRFGRSAGGASGSELFLLSAYLNQMEEASLALHRAKQRL